MNFKCFFYLLIVWFLIFRATVVEDKTTFWIDHVSNNIEVTLSDLLHVYDDCDVSKFCFGLPEGCIDQKNCLAFGAVIVNNEKFEFEMMSNSELLISALMTLTTKKISQMRLLLLQWLSQMITPWVVTLLLNV